MTEPALSIPSDELEKLQAHIADTVTTGVDIRKILSTYSGTYPYDEAWEVSAAVMALRVFASRWTIEILSALYSPARSASMS